MSAPVLIDDCRAIRKLLERSHSNIAVSLRPRGRGLSQACIDNTIWGCFSIMEANPDGNPYNSGLDHRRQGRDPALLPQAASVGAGRAVGAGQPRRPGVRRAERQQARADHLPRRHVPRDGARGRLQGRRDHPAHRRLHRADPPRLEDHQPGQRLLQPGATPRASACAAATAASTRWARACSATSTAR